MRPAVGRGQSAETFVRGPGGYFKRRLNEATVPAWGLVLQGLWAMFLVLPRTYDPVTRAYGCTIKY